MCVYIDMYHRCRYRYRYMYRAAGPRPNTGRGTWTAKRIAATGGAVLVYIGIYAYI